MHWLSAFSGRGDYQALINGILSGGLFTGAEVVKTAEQQAIWGGVAGKSFDPCYHLACDTIANVDGRRQRRPGDPGARPGPDGPAKRCGSAQPAAAAVMR